MTPADIFPFATCTTRNQQVDHTEPFDHDARGRRPVKGGQLRTDDQSHHRIKTHGKWKVKQPFPGIYLWRDPHGALYLVDHTGTRRLPRPTGSTGPASRIETWFSDIILKSAA